MAQTRLLLAVALAAMAEAAVSSKEQGDMLDLHNKYRCMAGVPGLVWDDKLAKAAQSWADTGNTGHSRSLGAFKTYGENMQYACPKSSPEDATDWWYAEISKYTAKSPFNAAHYTQMVWKGTKKIGCGKGKAPCGGDLWVCQFTPLGNQWGKYKDNVIAPTKTKAACGVTKLYESQNVPLATQMQSAPMWVGAALAVGGVVCVTGLASLRFLSRRGALFKPMTDADEELELTTHE